MPRKNLIRSNQHYYHVTSRMNNKVWFDIPIEKVWDFLITSCGEAQVKCPVIISQIVLMSNHYHLLLKTPDANLDKFMYELNKRFTSYLRKTSGCINRMLGGRYKWSLIQDKRYLYHVYKYIYQNPLRANLVTKCEQYAYSSLFYEYNNQLTKLGIELHSLFHQNSNDFLDSHFSLEDLNVAYEDKKLKAIKNGLYRSEFRYKEARP